MKFAQVVVMTKRRIVAILTVVLAVAVLAGWGVLGGHGGEQYRTVPVQRGDLVSTISATGTMNAVVTVQVGSQVSGNIKELYANFNSKVTKGQLIAQIDPQMFQAKVDQARANLMAAQASVINAQANVAKADAAVANAQAGIEEAKANVEQAQVTMANAKVQFNRRQPLFDQGIISREDRDTAQATYDAQNQAVSAAKARLTAANDMLRSAQAERQAAETLLKSAQAQEKQSAAALQQAQIDLSNTAIRAPVDGTVISRNVDVGQTVAASLQAPTLFLIAQDLTKMQVDTNVDEADIGKVKVAQPVNFTVDAFPGRTFRGNVTEVRQAPITVQNVVTYDVVVGVDNSELKLLPGMTANVSILTDRRQEVLKIPNPALLFAPPNAGASSKPSPVQGAGRAAGARPAGGAAPGTRGPAARNAAQAQTVWVLADGQPKPVAVQLGISDGAWTEVTGGDLKEGQPVITGVVAKDEQKRPTSQSFGGPRGPRF